LYLSQLEILGFKSFPEKTVLEFNGDVTAVVGPNGCGKTNILDSIRWVLGEQRTSALRSSKMEEVIFNGTAQLKPLGLAEVNLTIKNNRGILPIDYDEIVITRRLFRSGESEYLLNKSQCRLKDIMELFYDTGMGPHAYSVIQQGMIDAILSDKAEDRRGLFEEAAGVTKYKHRKKEAIAKLDATRADLLRLGDIMIEIEKQVNQLRRQAARARHFSRIKDELKNIEVIIAAASLFDLQAKFKEIDSQRSSAQFRLHSLDADFEKREVGLHETRIRITEHERLAAEHRQSQAELSSRASEIESEIKLNKHRIEVAGLDIEKGRLDIEALGKRIIEITGGIDDNSERLQEIEGLKSRLNESVSELEAELASRVAELLPKETEVDDLRRQNTASSEKISALKAEASSIFEIKNNFEQKLKELESSSDAIDQSSSIDKGGIAVLEQRRKNIEYEMEEGAQKFADKNTEIVRLENILARLRENIAGDKAELSGLKAKQELLGQLIETGEGLSSGARALMAWDDKPAGMMRPLVEALEVPERYRVAITSALGELGEVIPVRAFADAEAAVSFLQRDGGGRASFLVMENVELADFASDRPDGAQGFEGFADELVDYPDEYRLTINLLLGRTAIFENKDNMIKAADEWRNFVRVSLDGFQIEANAIVTGGRAGQTVLGRRQDLAGILSGVERLSDRIAGAESEFGGKLNNLQVQRNELSGIEKGARKFVEEMRKIDADMGQLRFDFKERQNKYAAAITQASDISSQIAHFSERIERINAELAELGDSARGGAGRLNSATTELLSIRGLISQLESRLTEARIKLIEHDSIVAKLRSDIEHGKELCCEAEKMVASNKAAVERADDTIKSSSAGNDELETRLYDIFAERREVQSKLHEIEDGITELMEETGKIDGELSSSRKEKDNLTAELHAVELKQHEIEAERRAVVERLRMEFNVASIEPDPLPQDKTLENLRRQADDIRLKLQRMDQVNLMAAEDYEREKDRLDFLVRQRDDLIKAEESLKEAINRINSTAEARFRETYARILENFKSVFGTLFEGGEARLELEDENDPLESPIRILARPGGKRLLSVAQLSGGERALTAISLLFSIYLVKPSPFCILDEVDAPLDDANLLLFLKLIKRFSESTQFIIITHNKLTMEASDVLYGVTMETPGVSKVVSVKFGNGNGGKGRG
jgi:chromosome segregation protein